MELSQKKFLIIGAARSGLETTKFLLQKGAFVIINDMDSKIKIPEEIAKNERVTLFLGTEPDVEKLQIDYIIVSPAVSMDKPFIKKAIASGTEVIGELELSYRFSQAPFIGITGTNGKTTTTSLIGELFEKAGFPSIVGGNIGSPLITQVEKIGSDGVIIAEISSFQLETIKEFKAHVAIITNLTPDHLDRHKTMEKYLEAKARIFENQTEKDVLILNYDDPAIKNLAGQTKSQVLYFSRKDIVPEGAFLEDGYVTLIKDNKKSKIIKAEDIFIKGGHNLENAMAGALAAAAMGISLSVIKEGLQSFKGVEHRLEFSGLYNGVTYVNDSKGTNPDASLKALDAYNEPMIIIAGGRNKGNSFDTFAKVISKKCKFAVLIGEAKDEIKKELDAIGFAQYFLTDDYREAIKKAVSVAVPGDVVMLSPACASWDMFENYEVRGNQFKELVKEFNGE